MLTVTTEDLFELWETMWNRSPCQQAVALVGMAYPELTRDEILSLPIGRRDALLMTLRSMLFGDAVDALATCPLCSLRSEFSASIGDFRADAAPLGSLQLMHAGRHYAFRLPNSEDLLAIEELQPEDPRDFLVHACLDLDPGKHDRLAPELIDAISTAMDEQDPVANILFDISCAECGHQWEQNFDIVSFLWSEINVWVHRLIGEVHALSLTYGWREADILAMSATRRQIYLGLVTA